MKKLLCCLLCILLTCSFILPALGEIPGFDIGVFENNVAYEVTPPAGTAKGDISPASYADGFFDPGLSDDYYSSFVPEIQLNADSAVLRLWCNLFADKAYNYDQFLITVAGRAYTIEGARVSSAAQDNGDTLERYSITVGAGLSAMIEQMRASDQQDTVCLSSSASAATCEFELTKEMKALIIGMYDDFVSAGGTAFYGAYTESAFTTTGQSGTDDGMLSGHGVFDKFPPSRSESNTTPELVGGLDLSLFDEDTYSVEPPTGSSDGLVDLIDYWNCHFEPSMSDNYYSYVTPDIVVSNSELYPSFFRIYAMLNTPVEYGFDEIVVTVAGKEYAIGDVQLNVSALDYGEVSEELVIVVSGELLTMIDEMIAHQSEEITMEFIAPEKTVSLLMPDRMKRDILGTYELFVEAGGRDQANPDNVFEHPVTVVEASLNGFKLSAFGDEYELSEPSESSYRYIDLVDLSPCFYDPGFSETHYCSFAPDVIVPDGETPATFRMWGYFYAQKAYNLDTAIFTFGNRTYTVKGIETRIDELDDGVREYLTIRIGTELRALVEDIRASLNGTITLTLEGPYGEYSFEMPRTMKQAIVDMYDTYLEAGGEAFFESVRGNKFSVK